MTDPTEIDDAGRREQSTDVGPNQRMKSDWANVMLALALISLMSGIVGTHVIQPAHIPCAFSLFGFLLYMKIRKDILKYMR